jgi:hypothetical protein
MTRIEDLRAWLKLNIKHLLTTFTEKTDVNEADCPCALVQYTGAGVGETLDANARTEKYEVVLMCATAGSSETERMSGIAVLEQALMLSVTTLNRQNPRWDHITADFVDAERGSGKATYTITLYVTGD